MVNCGPSCCKQARDPSPFDVVIAPLMQVLIFLANLSGGIVVGVATVRRLVRFIGSKFRHNQSTQEDIRLSLGWSLSLALEFQLGADILATALNPSARDIAVLGRSWLFARC